MSFKLWSPGEVVTSTDLNGVSKQTVIVCTSGTRPSSPNEGMVIYETDSNLFRYWTGSVWRAIITSTPAVMVSKNTASIANNSLTTISWDAEIYDSGTMWSSGSGVTIPVAGIWMVGLSVKFAGQATVAGVRSAQIFVNGIEQQVAWLPTTAQFNLTPLLVQVVHPMELDATDIIEGKAFHTAGASLNITPPTRMWAHLIAET